VKLWGIFYPIWFYRKEHPDGRDIIIDILKKLPSLPFNIPPLELQYYTDSAPHEHNVSVFLRSCFWYQDIIETAQDVTLKLLEAYRTLDTGKKKALKVLFN